MLTLFAIKNIIVLADWYPNGGSFIKADRRFITEQIAVAVYGCVCTDFSGPVKTADSTHKPVKIIIVCFFVLVVSAVTAGYSVLFIADAFCGLFRMGTFHYNGKFISLNGIFALVICDIFSGAAVCPCLDRYTLANIQVSVAFSFAPPIAVLMLLLSAIIMPPVI